MEYPEGRYAAPILMKPQNFKWMGIKDGSGEKAHRKLLGIFSERAVVIEQYKVEKGGRLRIGGEGTQFIAVLKGKGEVDGEVVERESMVRLQDGKKASLSTNDGIEILHYVLPLLEEYTSL